MEGNLREFVIQRIASFFQISFDNRVPSFSNALLLDKKHAINQINLLNYECLLTILAIFLNLEYFQRSLLLLISFYFLLFKSLYF